MNPSSFLPVNNTDNNQYVSLLNLQQQIEEMQKNHKEQLQTKDEEIEELNSKVIRLKDELTKIQSMLGTQNFMTTFEGKDKEVTKENSYKQTGISMENSNGSSVHDDIAELLNKNQQLQQIILENSNGLSLHDDIAELLNKNQQLQQIILEKTAENSNLLQDNSDLMKQTHDNKKKIDKLQTDTVFKENQVLNNQIRLCKLYTDNLEYPEKVRSKIEILGSTHFKISANEKFLKIVNQSVFFDSIIEKCLEILKSNDISLLPLKQYLLITNLSPEQKAYLHIETAPDDLQSKSQFLDFITSAKTEISLNNKINNPFLNSLRLYLISEDHTVLDKNETLQKFYFQVLDDFAKNVFNLYKFIVSEVDSRPYSSSNQTLILSNYKNIINILFYLTEEEFVDD